MLRVGMNTEKAMLSPPAGKRPSSLHVTGRRDPFGDLNEGLPRVQAGPQRHEVVGIDIDLYLLALASDGRRRPAAVDLARLLPNRVGDQHGRSGRIVTENEGRGVHATER
jgi:hypothetical protein